MNININRGIIISQEILGHLKRVQDDKINLAIDAYCNGREHGFQFIFSSQSTVAISVFTVAEQRNSDNIVIYKTKRPQMQGLSAFSEEDYATKTNMYFFNWNESKEAAKFIYNHAVADLMANYLINKSY